MLEGFILWWWKVKWLWGSCNYNKNIGREWLEGVVDKVVNYFFNYLRDVIIISGFIMKWIIWEGSLEYFIVSWKLKIILCLF